MRIAPRLLATSVLVVATMVAGCVGQYSSDFSIVVVNRAVNAIELQANGDRIGQVNVGAQGSFTLRLTETTANTFSNGVAPTPQSTVTLSAKDLRTGVLSTTKNIVLTKGTPSYVTFASTDFPVGVQTVARLTFSPAVPGINEEVAFSGATSTVSNGTYAWDFGDGTTGTGVTLTHRFPRAATFTVALTVTSDTGQTSTASRTVTVTTTLPGNAAIFNFSPTVPAVNQDVIFNASGSNVSNGTYVWEFGDGNRGTGVIVTHRFTRAGTYTVNLRVSNSVGQAAATARVITVAANSPTVMANFTFSPTNPGIDQAVFFNASASSPSSGTYGWTFGDGATGSGVMTTHTYSVGGTYVVTLTVTNDVGQRSTTARTFTVSQSSTVFVASFTFSPVDPSISRGTNSVIFDATGSSAGATDWTWDFGDGSSAQTGQRVTHTFERAATWVVRLIVRDSNGRTATTTRNVPVSP